MLDVKARGVHVRCFVRELERFAIDTLPEFNVTVETPDGRVFVRVTPPYRPGPAGNAAADKNAPTGGKTRLGHITRRGDPYPNG